VVRFLVTGAESGGRFTLLEVLIGPGMGPPPHVHRREDECFCILDGEVEITAAGDKRTFRRGQWAFGPKDVPHTFRNPGPGAARMLVFAAPSGIEHFLAEVGQPLPDDCTTPPPVTDAQIARVIAGSSKYGIEILGSPG
jgi:mannose-6-phosphate isomerase-like protein (cupin superfamily)